MASSFVWRASVKTRKVPNVEQGGELNGVSLYQGLEVASYKAAASAAPLAFTTVFVEVTTVASAPAAAAAFVSNSS